MSKDVPVGIVTWYSVTFFVYLIFDSLKRYDNYKYVNIVVNHQKKMLTFARRSESTYINDKG